MNHHTLPATKTLGPARIAALICRIKKQRLQDISQSVSNTAETVSVMSAADLPRKGDIRMSEEQVQELIRDFVSSLESKNLGEAVSFFTDDARCISPFGTFTGKKELKRYFEWAHDTIQDLKIAETGVGVLANENSGIIEHKFIGTVDGIDVQFLVICIYEFSDGEIRELRMVFDRLELAEQAAEGWLPKKAVEAVASNLRKGLD